MTTWLATEDLGEVIDLFTGGVEDLDFESFRDYVWETYFWEVVKHPVVGRMKARRWLQAATEGEKGVWYRWIWYDFIGHTMTARRAVRRGRNLDRVRVGEWREAERRFWSEEWPRIRPRLRGEDGERQP